MSNLKRLLGYLKPHWILLAIVALAMLASTFLEMSPAMLLRKIIDDAVPNGNLDLLFALSLSFIGVACVKGAVLYIQWYLSELIGQKVIFKLRQDVHDHLQTLPPSYFTTMGTGQIMARLTSDIDSVQNFIGWGALLLVNMIAMTIGVSGYLAYLNWRLMIASVLTFPFLFRTVLWFDKSIRPAWKHVRERMGELTEVLQENITGIRVIKAFAHEPGEIEKFARKNYEHYRSNMERANVEAKAQPMLDFFSDLSVVIMIGYGGYLVLTGQMSMGTLFAFYSLIWSLIYPVRTLGWLVNMSEQALAAAPRLFEILDEETEIRDCAAPIYLDHVEGHLVFENVSFSFPGDERQTLDSVSFQILPGETVAIVGGTGSGKSTLANMIPRFVDPTSGKILLDGHDIREVSLKSLRRNIGIVFQENFLFSATVRQNIALGKPDASLEEIMEAARLAQAHSFIMEFPKGYDTELGERGIGLSGGQKQRVALARALLIDPQILILDEATSSVDTETEFLIQENLDKVMEGRTSLIIAKRLSTIRRADKIVILSKGRIAQIGTHLELLSQPGFYRNLFESQFAEEDVERALNLELAGIDDNDLERRCKAKGSD
ncbi:MAG TPA: ABC transporter ATP-binding protein [Bacillota bacterium]|nr:ABC transporter ATP-binding protein [Candidatus Fermentithermobacillaceae bacterium]HOB30698.1 ABC transporter ATP-binding protein [Bacillota bacterium]HOL12067.1 ABC transporter ATP-binding protein [Bacillota bacterium]HOQ03097.1 ABC transporter ATP-binding protein [Bacillota bacterium]HPV13492.1 ABC transporter ATP-binding protein [Bacillota bacterium]